MANNDNDSKFSCMFTATIDIKRRICDIKTDGRDMYLAIVENAGERTQMGTDSVVRLYEVGRQKLEDDVDDNVSV